MTTNCHKFLDDHNMYIAYATYEDENAMQVFYDKLRQRISNQLSNIHEDLCLVSPSKDSYFLSFYTLLKIHKNPVRARPITSAFDSLTSRASKAVSDELGEIYKILSKQAQAQGFTSALTIYIKTEDVIKKANATIQACTDSQGLSFTTFDFDGMYNHLDATMTINTIKNLAIRFCNLPLDHPLQLAASRKKKSNFNPNTWNQLYDLEEHDPFSINISHLLLLLHVILEEYPFCICTYLPLKLFKQIKGITMGMNCASWVANLFLAFYELKYDHNLHLSFPNFLSRYINDVNCPHSPSLDPLPILLKIYKPTGLKLLPAGTKDGNIVFLDLQFPIPQLPPTFSFGLYCKNGTNYEYPHFNSFIPCSIHIGLVIGGFHHIFNRNSHLNQFTLAWNKYINILKQCGYSEA
jgi:hypothetical protein